MTDPLQNLANEIGGFVEDGEKERRLRAVPPAPRATSVVQATNEDTARATRNMLDQLLNIIKGLEAELAECDAIRLNVLHRMTDLKLALDASRSAVETLKVRGSLK